MARTRSTSAFPVFDDGDVEFRLTRNPADRYVLHSVVLNIHSSFFQASLSSEWTPPRPETTAETGTKWTYELQFTPGTLNAILVKVQSTAVVESSGTYTTADTSRIYLSKEPWAPTTNRLTASRQYIIEAHRQFLRILYHQPKTFPNRDFGAAISLVINTVDTADKYCALPAVSWYMENHLMLFFQTATSNFCIDRPHQALQLSLWMRSSWIFRETAIRLIAAPGIDDAQLTARFNDLGVVPLLLCKRAWLKAQLRSIDVGLLTLDIQAAFPNDQTTKIAGLVFRELLARYYREDRLEERPTMVSKWPTYARFYRTIMYFSTHWKQGSSLTLLDDSGLAELADRPRFVAAFETLLGMAAAAVEPLLRTSVGREVGLRHLLLEGLTCFGISDEELPWNGRAL